MCITLKTRDCVYLGVFWLVKTLDSLYYCLLPLSTGISMSFSGGRCNTGLKTKLKHYSLSFTAFAIITEDLVIIVPWIHLYISSEQLWRNSEVKGYISWDILNFLPSNIFELIFLIQMQLDFRIFPFWPVGVRGNNTSLWSRLCFEN